VNNVSNLFLDLIPKPQGLGIIKALAELATVFEKEKIAVLKFDAGLPDHERPDSVGKALIEYGNQKEAPYSRYPSKEGSISESSVLPSAVQYHKEVVGIESDVSRFVLTEGSTPALNHMIRMMALEKAKADGKKIGENCVLETFELSYPLYSLPANDVGISVSSSIKLETEIDIEDGKVIQSKPWQLNKNSLEQSFINNRDKVTTFVFSSPSNPSGYNLSVDETDFIAEKLTEDLKYRKENGLPAKLVIQDIAYITMMHDDNFKPYTLVHSFNKLIEQEKNKTEINQERLELLEQAKETVLTIHSLSKAAGLPGDRVAYTEGNPELINYLREAYTRDMLSYSNSGLHIAKAAFEAGAPDRNVMNEYSHRIEALEEGINKSYYKVIADLNIPANSKQIKDTMPFPNKCSGSFFTVMNLKPLVGQQVDIDFVNKVQSYIDKIPNEGIRNSFGKIFENNQINEKDLPLYMMFKTLEHSGTAISTVPLKDGMVRFSVGITPVDDVKKSVASISEFFNNDPLYKEAVLSCIQKSPQDKLAELFLVSEAGIATAVSRK
jgi:aspartate/methionine/tyrosine aminotransferase